MRRFPLLLAATALALAGALTGAAQANDGFQTDSNDSQARAQVQTEADPAEAGEAAGQDRLMIVSRNTGRVVYDDGRNDLYCVTARYTVGYTYDGRPIRRRSMNCR